MPKSSTATRRVANLAQTLNEEQQGRALFAVVASGYRMADGTAQDVARAMVRFRDGSLHYVFDLPKIDKNNPQPNGDYVLPLVNDHSGRVSDQAGACWLFIGDDALLHALIVFSTNEAAASAEPLARDGFIQFSTEGFCSEIGEDGVYGDFWITAVAPVTVGNDPATQVVDNTIAARLAAFERRLNSLEEDMMPEQQDTQTTTPEATAPTPAEAPAPAAPDAAATPAPAGPQTQPTNEAEADEPKPDEEAETMPQETPAAEVASTPTTPAANALPTPPQSAAAAPDLMAGRAALQAYANAIRNALRNRGGQAAVSNFMEVWKRENNITGAAIVPEQIVSTFFKAWLDNEQLSFVRFMNAKAGAVYAGTTTDTAKGHAKGAAKANQTIELLRRDLRALAMYKRLPIDRQDLFDDESGALIQFRAQELAARLTNQQLVAILLGGTEEGSVLSTAGASTRGLYGIMDDADAAAGTFGSLVATKVQGVAGDDAYAAVVKVVNSIVKTVGGNVTSSGRASNGVTLFVPWAEGAAGWIAQLLLTKTADGNEYMFNPQNIEAMLRVSRIVEVPELAASGRIVAVADGAYQLYGENAPQMFPFFDTENNTDNLLAEQFVAGSLAGYKQAAVYVPAV